MLTCSVQSCWATIYEIVPETRVGGVSGFIHLLSNISGIIGPTATGLAVQYLGGYSSAFAIASALAVAGVVAMAVFVKRPGAGLATLAAAHGQRPSLMELVEGDCYGFPRQPVLLTGASGALGQMLARELAGRGWKLRLTDRAPFPGSVPEGASFTLADLNDGAMILRLAEGCGTILHFGGVSVEHPFETVIGPNIRGLYHAYEAARREKARMVFASSNHTIGFHERGEVVDDDSYLRPGRVLWPVESLWRIDGALVLGQAWCGERVSADRFLHAQADR